MAHQVSRNPGFLLPTLPPHTRLNLRQIRCCPKRLRTKWSMRAPANKALQVNLAEWGVSIDPDDRFGNGISAISVDPPLLRIDNFITPSECDALIALQRAASSESDLYLNYRVNQEVRSTTASLEAEKLIGEFSSSRATLDARMRSGFRAQVPAYAVELEPVLRSTRAALGFGGRRFVFAEGLWTRPNRRTVVVRDQTSVRYDEGEGVAPHVDGKDATVLVCLQEPEEGGRTVFPVEGIAVKPVKGSAVVYESKTELLHFAEAVGKGQKWVLQLLIDFRVRDDEPDVDFGTGQVYSC